MRKIQLLLVLLMAAAIHGNAQRFPLHGLEIYNPAYNNPAYTGADKLIQADAIVYSNPYNTGIYSSIMGALPGGESALGVSFDKSGYYRGYSSSGGHSEKSMSRYNVALTYKYTFRPWKNTSIHTGASVNAGKLDILSYTNMIDSSWQYNRYLSTIIGVAVDYKNFTAGISGHFPVSANRFYLDETNSLEKESITSPAKVFHMYGKYESKSQRRVTFDPLFGMYWLRASDSDHSEWLGYVGGHIQIVDVVGLGITAGSLVSVSATVNILDRVELMLGIYAGEQLLDDGPRSLDYGLNFGNKEYLMQLRINL